MERSEPPYHPAAAGEGKEFVHEGVLSGYSSSVCYYDRRNIEMQKNALSQGNLTRG